MAVACTNFIRETIRLLGNSSNLGVDIDLLKSYFVENKNLIASLKVHTDRLTDRLY